jgi:hypothetical protein
MNFIVKSLEDIAFGALAGELETVDILRNVPTILVDILDWWIAL